MSTKYSKMEQVNELNRVEAKGGNVGRLKADKDKHELVKQNKDKVLDFIFGRSDINPLEKK